MLDEGLPVGNQYMYILFQSSWPTSAISKVDLEEEEADGLEVPREFCPPGGPWLTWGCALTGRAAAGLVGLLRVQGTPTGMARMTSSLVHTTQ